MKYFPILILLLTALSISGQNTDKPNNEVKYTPVKITQIVRPMYTDAARKEGLDGTVRLKIEFKEDGTIGEIQYVAPPKDVVEEDKLESSELVGEAIKAAKQIKFIPATKNDTPYTVIKSVHFVFQL